MVGSDSVGNSRFGRFLPQTKYKVFLLSLVICTAARTDHTKSALSYYNITESVRDKRSTKWRRPAQQWAQARSTMIRDQQNTEMIPMGAGPLGFLHITKEFS